MDNTVVFVIAGGLVILAAWSPLFLGSIPLSLPMIAVAIGAALPFLVETYDPLVRYSGWVEHVTEFALLVAVLGAGLKIDRRFSLRRWTSTWRLLLFVMPLSIAAIAAAGWWLLDLPLGLTILLGSAIAPTDPVLASSVQLGPPGTGEEGETKFALTSEAGLNDGLAFPFVILALLLIGGGVRSPGDWLRWLAVDLVWNIAGGIAVGITLGAILVALNRRLPERLQLPSTHSGIVSVGLAFLAYGLADVIDGNGFVAVFCEAVTIRNLVPSFAYSRRLNHASEQFERVVMVIVLAFLGSAIWHGLLADIGGMEVLFALMTLLLIRPLATLVSFIGSAHDVRTRGAIGYFGLRGLGSLYYVTYAVSELPADAAHRMTAIIGLVVLISIVLYGTTTDAANQLILGETDK